jgi:hypothetical protein
MRLALLEMLLLLFYTAMPPPLAIAQTIAIASWKQIVSPMVHLYLLSSADRATQPIPNLKNQAKQIHHQTEFHKSSKKIEASTSQGSDLKSKKPKQSKFTTKVNSENSANSAQKNRGLNLPRQRPQI